MEAIGGYDARGMILFVWPLRYLLVAILAGTRIKIIVFEARKLRKLRKLRNYDTSLLPIGALAGQKTEFSYLAKIAIF